MRRNAVPTDAEISAALDDLDAMPDTPQQTSDDNWAGTYADDIAAVLRPRIWPGMARHAVIDEVYSRRAQRPCNMPRKFEQTVQNAFNQRNDQSAAKRQIQDVPLFTSHVIGGQTYWAMRVYRRPIKS